MKTRTARDEKRTTKKLLVANAQNVSPMRGSKLNKLFWWRYAQGRHPFSSRTRWLRLKRPMVLCWKRYGRVGGCQIYMGVQLSWESTCLASRGSRVRISPSPLVNRSWLAKRSKQKCCEFWQRNVLTKHLASKDCSVACRHAIQIKIEMLRKTSFPRLPFYLCFVP